MFEVGPAATKPLGRHVRTLDSDAEMIEAQQKCQGPHAGKAHDASKMHTGVVTARPGTFLVEEQPESEMPATAMSANVGGMGAHWTCACPRFGAGEVPEFIDRAEYDHTVAEVDAGRWMPRIAPVTFSLTEFQKDIDGTNARIMEALNGH